MGRSIMTVSGRSLAVAFLLTASTAWPMGQRSKTCDDLWPVWSPDGAGIVFVSTRSGDHEIYRLALRAAATPVRLTRMPGRDAHPSFSPDGKRIAFQSPREPGGHTNLYVMSADGSDQRRVTHHKGFAGMPVWSPDGRQLAYQWTAELGVAKWRLMLLDLHDAAGPRHLTDGSANDQVVNWAPDGKQVVFHSDRTGQDQLFVMRLSGGVTSLTTSQAPDRSGSWSPDGRLIAFKSERHGVPAGVYVMDADGSEPRRVGAIASGHGVPFFSPDGRRLLVTQSGPHGTEILTVRTADGVSELISRCRPD